MKNKLIYKLALLSGLACFIFGSYTSMAQTSAAATTTSSGCSGPVYFGTHQENGGVCVGRGMCADGNTSGVNVNFTTSANYPNTLIMTLSMSQLQQVQPDQVQYFTSGSYMFDANYCLSSDPFFAPLNLPANSWILTTSNSYVVINGDVITDYIQYAVVPTN